MASSSLFLECESTLDLGFAEDAPGWLLASRFFRSKLGGRPSWLDLKNIPSNEELTCKSCGKQLIFLLQIYAPIETDPKCFHRVLFVFLCTDPKCHQDSNLPFKVLRSQLPRENEFFPKEPPVESPDWKPELNASKYNQICRASGLRAGKKCSGCGKVPYCCRENQTQDWKFRHKIECKNPDFSYKYNDNEELLGKVTLPQFEIVLCGDDEVISDSDDEKEVDEEKEMQKLKELQESGGTLTKEEISKFASEDEVEMDRNFKRFQKVVKCAPDQVIRYQRLGNPLWISTKEVLKEEEIPCCEICGSKRVFEFQIMPQLLSILKLDQNIDKQSVDWGVLAIYTCEKSCTVDDDTKAYKNELIFKQMVS